MDRETQSSEGGQAKDGDETQGKGKPVACHPSGCTLNRTYCGCLCFVSELYLLELKVVAIR
jgi:hypothetical protein